jgi:hypothetical protein
MIFIKNLGTPKSRNSSREMQFFRFNFLIDLEKSAKQSSPSDRGQLSTFA